MMAVDHREIAFEAAIEHHLLKVAIDTLREYRSALIFAIVTGKIDL